MKFLQSLCTIIAIFISVTVTAQDADQQQNPDRGMEKILTPEQLALLKEQNELVKSQREAFKNSLSDEQLAILENTDLKISSFDLNLFVILNAIYTEGSLTKAAEVVGITQPAVSNALSRLRERFNDDLFVRTGSGMVPTQKTENIIKDIQNALTLMQHSVNEPDTFDEKTTTRTFKLSLGKDWFRNFHRSLEH